MILQVMLSELWVTSTKPGAALDVVPRPSGLGRRRGWFMAPCDRGPETDVHCLEGHLSSSKGVACLRKIETKIPRSTLAM